MLLPGSSVHDRPSFLSQQFGPSLGTGIARYDPILRSVTLKIRTSPLSAVASRVLHHDFMCHMCEGSVTFFVTELDISIGNTI